MVSSEPSHALRLSILSLIGHHYYVLPIILLILITYANAEGNITTSSGNLYLQPSANIIVGQGRALSIYDSSNSDYTQLYNSGGNTRIVDALGSIILEAKNTSTSTISFSMGYSALYFDTDSNRFLYYMRPRGGAEPYSGFLHQPNNNASNNVAIYMGYNNLARAGITIMADQNHDKKLMPWDTNQYDLGSSSNWWNNSYISNVHYSNLIAHSTGFVGTPEQAYDVVSKIHTLDNGEIDHTTVDDSLSDDTLNSLSLNAVTFANSKALVYLNQRLDVIEDENNALKQKVSDLERVCSNKMVD